LQQGSFVDTLEVIEKDIDWVVLAKITPDKGLISLTPVNPTTVEDEIVSVDKFELFQNYPNPFNPTTKIRYSIPSTHLSLGEGLGVRLIVYDILGNEVTTLVNEQKEPGYYEVEFSATGGATQFASGVYIYRLQAGNYISTKKMMVLK
jgi:hypothetical protein